VTLSRLDCTYSAEIKAEFFPMKWPIWNILAWFPHPSSVNLLEEFPLSNECRKQT
jgi:hypothetical protein